ncbi:hypothetical protein L226DRAFT_245765 [Lentinus tigrinus ALCF2SS1-7]|uniref:uncharacterized protein n=1 Tax=Lentinus tigrinus ALCF2SS1-7 TaxID=1328758 RepID=UPI001165E06A|nr:hypothetical protein L226DRAFT_245765 [Lentinus tigrinus ALCF2SS1-7]
MSRRVRVPSTLSFTICRATSTGTWEFRSPRSSRPDSGRLMHLWHDIDANATNRPSSGSSPLTITTTTTNDTTFVLVTDDHPHDPHLTVLNVAHVVAGPALAGRAKLY